MKLLKSLFFAFITLFIPVMQVADAISLQNKPASRDTVKIGLLIPDNQSVAAKNGADLAVRKANNMGGINGNPVRLIIRSMEGPWGTGSKQTISLIFDENIAAILGSHDGRNAHLAEQASAKTGVVFLSAWTGDPTLSRLLCHGSSIVYIITTS